jgi:hypothetical protein
MDVHGQERTVVSEPRWLTPALFAGLPVLGAVLGWCLSLLADWYTGLPVAPFRGVVELLSDLTGRLEGVVDAGIGAVAGLLLAVAVVGRLLTVTVDRGGIEASRGDDEQRAEAGAIASVFVADKRMTVLGHGGEELVSIEFDLDSEELRAAVERHGHRWAEADPFAGEYRLWVFDDERLPPGANAVLTARRIALEKSKGDDAAELRAELGKLGVVVRDEGGKQYWRSALGAVGH